SGAVANPDEERMVGHYWLRNAALAPTGEIRKQIEEAARQVKSFAHQVHSGAVRGAHGEFKHVLLAGIGGSALGPQLAAKALGHPAKDRMKIHFLDNTDPDGFDRVLGELGNELGRTL